MNRCLRSLTLAAALVGMVAGGCSTAPQTGKPYTLFNGRNLDGWVVEHGGAWDVKDGILTAHDGKEWSTNPEKSGSWLRTRKEYRDFILELEYSVNKGGNSGIFIRSGTEKNPAFTGHEMQILDDAGREPKNWTTGALYAVVAPTVNASNPAGQWNTVRIEARGPRVQIWVNGKAVIDHEPVRSLRGYIGLQNHDDKAVTQFRNIRLTEL